MNIELQNIKITHRNDSEVGPSHSRTRDSTAADREGKSNTQRGLAKLYCIIQNKNYKLQWILFQSLTLAQFQI